ncbi:MAG TPA: ABC transporter ATP-binding protein [Thermomicrobiales bacterium]|nr:ABC transporter ATP-binding protein [Thermomicrobiales bacterium]
MIAATPDVASAAPAMSPAAPPIIEAHDLTKRYGGKPAVDGVDLAIAPGEIFGILGPNGAGKTTTLEMIEGLRAPDAGTIRIGGCDPIADGDKVRRMIGVQLQSTALFDYLSAAELIALFAGLYDVDDSPARVDALLALVGLEEKRRARVDELSGGQKQRLAIAISLVNEPRIVFLDEPTTGLDPAARRALWGTIRDIEARGATVVLTTHYLEEAEALCDRVAVMERGRIIACDSPAALIRTLGAAATIHATVVGGAIPAEALAALPSVLTAAEETTDDGVAIRLETADVQQTLVGLLALAAGRDATLAGLSSRQSSLEDVYLRLTGHAYEPGVGEPPAAEGRKRRRRL